MSEEKMVAIAPKKRQGSDADSLFHSLFYRRSWRHERVPTEHRNQESQGEYRKYPLILMGGWKNDYDPDGKHHVQLITTDAPPTLDITKIIFPCKFPFKGKLPLDLKGFIKNDGDFLEAFSFCEDEAPEEWEIDYPEDEALVYTIDENKWERFDLINCLWLPDGRIFSFNDDLITKMIKFAHTAAHTSHEGYAWMTIKERRVEKKEAETHHNHI